MNCTEFTFEPAPLQAFLDFPKALYGDDPSWVPPPYSSLQAVFSPGYPFYAHGESENIVIWEDGEVVGRIGVAINRKLTTQGEPVGLIGFYESVPDPAVAAHLFEHARRWFARKQVSRILGPINLSTWHSYRLVTDHWANPPFLAEPHSKPYYPEQWQASGFKPIAHYVSTEISDQEAYLAALAPKRQAFDAAGFTLRPFDAGRIEGELRLMHGLTARIFAGNLFYTPIEWQEFHDLYAGARRLIRAGLSWWALDPRGEPVGFVFGYPDLAEAVRRMSGRTDFPAKVRYLLAPKSDRAVLKTLGVLPEARGAHVGSALTHQFHAEANRRGYARVVHALMHADNHSRRISAHGGRLLRTYAVFEGLG